MAAIVTKFKEEEMQKTMTAVCNLVQKFQDWNLKLRIWWEKRNQQKKDIE